MAVVTKFISSVVFHFIFDVKQMYVPILHTLRVIASCLSRIADFNLPHLHLLGMTPIEFRQSLRRQKTRFAWLSCVVFCVILSLAVWSMFERHISHRDGQTHGGWIYRAIVVPILTGEY